MFYRIQYLLISQVQGLARISDGVHTAPTFGYIESEFVYGNFYDNSAYTGS